MGRPLIIGNWKMNPSNSKEAFDLAKAVVQGLQDVEADAVLCPPFVYVPQLLPSVNVFIGAQDSFWKQEGPYTGEVSPFMLKNLGCSYVILGHSERRNLGETPEIIAKKIQAALDAALIPVVCIGENIEQEMTIILKNIKHSIGNLGTGDFGTPDINIQNKLCGILSQIFIPLCMITLRKSDFLATDENMLKFGLL